jgi:two-component system, cell cycle sensor histidine kinase and response regulator CckA
MPSQTKVLIVEDEAIVACDIERRLLKAGYAVPAIAASGEEALVSIEQTRPNLVLMDIHLDGPSDGIAVASEVRDRFQLPVVFLTAYADKATLERANASGAFSYLVKPIGQANLASTIEVALYKHGAEQELKHREAWLRTVLHVLPDAMVVTEASGSIQFLNPSAERFTGWTHSDAVGRQLSDVVRLTDMADRDLTGELNTAMATGVPLDVGESRLISREGRVITVEGHVAISRVDDKPSGAVVTFRDVTARHWQETQVRQDQKMLVAGQLANGIARDFNRVLTVILRYSEQLLGEMDEGNGFRPRVQTIHRAGNRAAVLIARVLGLCRKETPDARIVNLNSVVNRFLPRLKRMAGPSIVIETSLDPQLGTIRADTSQMKQILLNLILNARDAMPLGGSVYIQTGNVELPGSYPFVRLAVEDNGAGMDSEIAEHLFEPFLTNKKPSTGKGLGLAVVHAMVSAADGLVNVDSKPGVGSCFEIFLPRVTEPRPQGSGE